MTRLTCHVEDIIQTRDPLHFAIAHTCDTEDGRGVDGYTSDTDPLLHDLEPDDKLDTTTSVELAGAYTEQHCKVRLRLGSLAFKLGDVADILEFGLGPTQVRTGLTTKTAENVAGFFFATDLGEPTWGLGKEPNNAQEEQKRDDLESDGETPGERGGSAFVEAASVFEPVGDNDTEDIQCEFNGDELTTRFVLGGFGGPDRHDGVENTSTPSIDETSADHPVVVLGRALKAGTENGPASTESDCLDTPIAVTERAPDETTHEGTEIVDGNLLQVSKNVCGLCPSDEMTHDASLEESVGDDRCASDRIRVAKFHGFVVVIRGVVDTSHHTLIITEEEDTETGHAIDGDQQASLL